MTKSADDLLGSSVSRPPIRRDIFAGSHFNGRIEDVLTERQLEPKTLHLSLTGSFIAAKHNLIPLETRVASNSIKMSAAATSTLVTGSAATFSQCTGVGEAPPSPASTPGIAQR